MLKYVLILFLLPTVLSAQPGLYAGYSSGEASSLILQADYRLPLKAVRMEILPTAGILFLTDSEVGSNAYTAGVHLRLFPLDFTEGCNCPSIYKSKKWFKKGFFVKPGALYNRFNDFDAFSFPVQLGIELVLSDRLSLAPQGGMIWYSKNFRSAVWMAGVSLRLYNKN